MGARPLSLQDGTGAATGYSVALCGKIAEAVKAEPGLAGLSVDYVPVSAEDRFRAVDEGRVALLCGAATVTRSEEHTSEIQSLMRISYAVFCLNKNRSPTSKLISFLLFHTV